MPLLVNLRHLEKHSLKLKGEMSPDELDLELRDDLVQTSKPLSYDIEVERLDNSLLAQGTLILPLKCTCVRCLKSFASKLKLNPWVQHLPLTGEEKVEVVNDCVDLTPFIREDILLEFPQHPLCEPDCRGLPKNVVGKVKQPSDAGINEAKSSAWAALDKLKLKK